MSQGQAGGPIRVVIAAPFKELVDIHERASEFADELDVCGVVSNAGSVVDQAQVLQPDVLILSEGLGAQPSEVAAGLAASSPATKLVMLVSDRNSGPRGGATALRLDATGSELRAAVLVAAGRLRGQTAPAAHAGAGGATAAPRWFWEDGGAQGPAAAPDGSMAAAPSPAPAAAMPGAEPSAVTAEASAWPPPWLHIEIDEQERLQVGTAPPAWLDGDAVSRPPRDHEAASMPAAAEDVPAAAAADTPPPPAPVSEMWVVDVPPIDTGQGNGGGGTSSEHEGRHRARGWMKRGAARETDDDEILFDLAFPTSPATSQPSSPWLPQPPDTSGVAETEVPTAPAAHSAPADTAPAAAPAPLAEPSAPAIIPTAPVRAPSAPIEPAPAPAAVIAPPLLTEPTPEPAPAEAIVEQPRVRTRKPGRTRAETILVFSGKGGVGKSVVATNLAVALSAREAKVALVDLNLQYGDIGLLLHIESHPSSIELLAQQGEQVDRDYIEDVMATGPESLRVLLAPASPEFADLVTATSVRAVLRELSHTYDYVIVDSPAHIEDRVLEVIEVADQILVVSSFNITSVKAARVTLGLLQSLGVERDRIAVVLNQTQPKAGFSRADIEKSMRAEVLAQLPYDADLDETVDRGRPMVLGHAKSEFAKQFRTVVDFIAADGAPVPARPGDEARERPAKRRLFGR
jgi:MinD-like ATPase involved in chromosome partitioning or flagellar assembly